MSQPNRNERLGALTAGIILVVVAAMLFFTRHVPQAEQPQPLPEPTTVEDTVSTHTEREYRHAKKPKKPKRPKKQHRAPANQGPVRDPLSE